MPPPPPHLLYTNPAAPLPLVSTFFFLSDCLAYSPLLYVALFLSLLARLWLPYSLISPLSFAFFFPSVSFLLVTQHFSSPPVAAAHLV